MTKPSRIVGRSALAAVMALSMVPTAALAQEVTDETVAGDVVKTAEVVDETPEVVDGNTSQTTQEEENSPGDIPQSGPETPAEDSPEDVVDADETPVPSDDAAPAPSANDVTVAEEAPAPAPAAAPEKAVPGLSAYGSTYRYGKADGTYAKSEWVTIDGKRYYFGADGQAAKWETWIDGSFYYFNGKCQMHTGWLTWNADGSKSYFGSDGKAQSGFMKQGAYTYYLSPATFKSVKWEQKINGNLYYFNGKYQMYTGGLLTWKADGTKSYFGSNGKALKGFQKIGGKTYYFDPATCKSKRWEQWIGGKLYYFNGKYQMVTGWVTWNNDKSKSYFDGSGRALTGWQKLGGRTYYFNPATARSVRWEQTIDGAQYYFDGNGRMHTGWLQWNADKKWSYFYSNGKMATGTQTIDGTRYTFDANGKTSQTPYPAITGDVSLDRQIYQKAKQLGSLSACFNWVKNHTHTNWAGKGHHYSYGNYNLNSSWVIAEAKRMMNGQTTDCYAYAATFACMAKALGYNVQAVAGALPLRSGGVSYHGWCVIYQGGGTYVYDPNLAHSYPQYNFYKITYGSAPLTYIR